MLAMHLAALAMARALFDPSVVGVVLHSHASLHFYVRPIAATCEYHGLSHR